MGLFEITSEKGFHIKFNNGVTVSVQFGYGDYCSNRHIKSPDFRQGEDAAVLAWDSRDTRLRDIMTERSSVTPDEIVDILNWAKNLTAGEVEELAIKQANKWVT